MHRILANGFRIAMLTASLVAVSTAAGAADDAGKKAFLDQKCNKCHSVDAHGIERTVASEKMWGPDLGNTGATRDAEWVTQYVKKEVELDGSAHKNTYKGSDKELKAIVDWLMVQKSG